MNKECCNNCSRSLWDACTDEINCAKFLEMKSGDFVGLSWSPSQCKCDYWKEFSAPQHHAIPDLKEFLIAHKEDISYGINDWPLLQSAVKLFFPTKESYNE